MALCVRYYELNMKMNLAGRNEFIEGVKDRFPESFKEMKDVEDGLLHIDMGDFARTTESAIIEGNTELFQTHFTFISELFSKADPDLKNAIYVSYLENVFLFHTKQKFLDARKMLPMNLSKALVELEVHFEKLRKSTEGT